MSTDSCCDLAEKMNEQYSNSVGTHYESAFDFQEWHFT